MREILFKAKTRDNGEWIEGQLAYFFNNKETPYIMPNCYFGTKELGEYDENDEPIISNNEIALGGFIAVQPETVSQFTGFLDENGEKIFEGDILNCTDVYNDEPFKTTVRFKDGGFLVDCYGCDYDITCIGFLDDEIKLEIVGNIHEELKETK
jgi:uncharacterized phage protein (TIGR01671 family)